MIEVDSGQLQSELFTTVSAGRKYQKILLVKKEGRRSGTMDGGDRRDTLLGNRDLAFLATVPHGIGERGASRMR